MKDNSLSKNYLYNLFYNVAVGVAPLVTTPYLSRVLGPDGIGQYSFAQSIVTYFALFAALGTSQYGQRRIAYLQGQKQKQVQAFWEIANLRFLFTAIAYIIYVFAILRNCEPPILYWAVSLDILYVGVDISWYLWGKNSFSLVSICGCICKIGYIVFVFLCVKTPEDVAVYAILFSGANMIGCILQWYSILKTDSFRAWKPYCCIKKHLKPSLSLFTVQAATTIYTVLDKTMIGLITASDVQNGYYEQSQKLVRMVIMLVTAVSPVIATTIATHWTNKDLNGIQQAMEQSFSLVLGLSIPCCLGLILIAKRFVPFYYGNGFLEIIPMIYILAFLIPAVSCSSALGIQYFIPSGQEQHYRHAVIFSAVINVFLNSILIPNFSAIGASVASVLAEWSGTIWMFVIIRNQISLIPIMKQAIRYVLYGLVMFNAGALLSLILGQKVLSLIILVIICVASYGGSLFITHDPLLKILFYHRKNKTR